ncbi:DEAD/DEAH box helicase family protein [Microbacterium sp. NPDC055665]
MLEDMQRPATADEQRVLAGWSSWGAVPEVFDESKTEWSTQRSELLALLSADEWRQARRTTLSAHYTSPDYVEAVWEAVAALGFDGGEVLEPGSGSGTFLGMAPSTARMTGVELDTTTARISQALYPAATVRAESFVDTAYPTGYFDATIGNVPFANVVPHDRVDNANGHSLHNYFILKSLRLTRPGGLVAVLTSHYTLDAGNPGARREMNAMADLVGAVRLPSGAHRRTAGTEAVTDLLIFRRREPGTPPADRLWEGVTARMVDGVKTRVNSYFDRRPEHILGTLHVGQGMYGSETTHVRALGDLQDVPAQLRDALSSVLADAEHAGHRMTPRTDTAPAPVLAQAAEAEWGGTIHALPNGKFETTTREGRVPLKVPKSAAVELRTLLELRDHAKRQLATERIAVDDTTELQDGRAALRAAWDRYVHRYGPVNRYTSTSTGRTNEAGEVILARRTPTAPRLLRDDPFGPLVFALEVFDEEQQTAQPAALLERRVIVPRPEKQGADSPLEALNLSLDRTGTADLQLIADLLGEEPHQARQLLADLVYDDPATDAILPAAAYLSGNIADRLDVARTAAAADDRYRANVEALEKVLPEPLTPEEISAKIGAVWISPDIHEEFLQELLRDRNLTVTNPLPAEWQVRGAQRYTVLATSEWGTERRPASDLFEALANQARVRVDDKIKDVDGRERLVFNAAETTAAQEKADLIQQRFEEWVWEDPDRARALTAIYNRTFNSIALRDYTAEGNWLTFPGMAEKFELRSHQRAAVARMISEPAVGLFHEVGSGKTAEMVAGAMELKRMGMITKPAVVIPNHMLEQFTREWMQIYPDAKVLAASTDTLAGDKRRLFVARAAANDWDAIIMTREAFRRLPVEPETSTTYLNREIDLMRQALDSDTSMDRQTIKRIEKKVARLEEKQKALLDVDRDPGITFEATGIDYLIIDELHDYKNLSTVSRIPDANIDGAARSTDLAVKLEYLRATHGHRVVTGATATPIANSITEAHVMMRYLRPDLLRAAGVEQFDAWAATFGRTVDEIEMAPQGGGAFRMKTRFAKFQNVPEMLRMWHVFADVKTADDLDLPTPPLRARADGKRIPETIAIDPTPEVLDYVRALGERADAVAAREVSPEEDNMLKISTDGRKAALDIRMVDRHAHPAHSPLDTVADNIARIHHEHAGDTFTDTRTGQPSPLPGALQIVFCDLGTPNPARWNAYDELRAKLVDRGVPAGGIRFVHEAKNDHEKARLFAAARDGGVAVLIGSTMKMGVGTNVQARAVALHDVDAPWKPAEVHQRHGRIIRQGNQNPEVEIYQYVVTGTFGAYMWQAIERKSRFINQIMRGRLDVRELDDLGSDTLSAAEAKALASGNPLLLERSVALNEMTRLERLERAWHRNQRTLHATVRGIDARESDLTTRITTLEDARGRAQDLSGDRFRITVGDRQHTSRADAAAAVRSWADRAGIRWARPLVDDRPRGIVGEISGFPIRARTHTDLGIVHLQLDLEGIPGARVRIAASRAVESDDIGLIRMLENRVTDIPQMITTARDDLDALATARADAERGLMKPFTHTEALDQARSDLHHIDEQLAALAADDAPAPEPSSIVAPDDTHGAVQSNVDAPTTGSAVALAERAEQLLAKVRASVTAFETAHNPAPTFDPQATLAQQPRGPRP